MERSVTCLGTCGWMLPRGVYWFEVRALGRSFTLPVAVTEPQRVVVERPNEDLRAMGIIGIIVGGALFGMAALLVSTALVSCSGKPSETKSFCSGEGFLPMLLAMAPGAVVGGVGIGLFVGNNKPSLEILPVNGNGARREHGTFAGVGSVEGATLPGPSLQVSF
jgi:hypothetical protein